MSALGDACRRRPFANGSAGDAWMDKWCGYCAHDHGAHVGEYDKACQIILTSMLPDFPSDEYRWPEPWMPEPDDGRFFLPSRLVCLAFEPCEPCGGDPGEQARSERIAEVRAYWRERSA